MIQSREFPQLETERLILREMTTDDVGFYFRHFTNDKIIEGSFFPGPKNLEAALIGTCGFYDWNKTAYRAEIGYDLDPAFWRHGLMTEALLVLLRFGFEKMKLNRIQAIIDSENSRSIRLVQRLGFKMEGVLRQNSYFNGQYRDELCFSLLKHEWKKSST